MNNKLYKLEALRGLAAIYVVLHHTLPHTYNVFGFNAAYLIRFGQEAVILFFLLSGFVINYSFARSRNKSFKHYFTNRFLRIYIPLIIVFFIGYLSVSYNEGKWVNPELGVLAGNLLMLQDWAFAKPNVLVEPYMGNNPLWSLSYEWWFYMAYYPLVVYIKNESTRDTLVFGVSVIAAALYIYYPYFITRLGMYFAIWWGGVYYSNLFIQGRLNTKILTGKPVIALTLISSFMTFNILLHYINGKTITFGVHPFLELRHFAFALIAVFGAFIWKSFEWKYFDILTRPFAFIAPISYVMYIIHYHLFTNASFLSFIGNSVLEWILYFCTILLFSYAIEIKYYPYIKNLTKNSGTIK